MTSDVTGQCLCGAVSFRLAPPLREASLCHCGQCRRWHGHAGAYTNVPRTALTFTESRGLAWYQSSSFARRGFCRECGSSLFWDAPRRDTISVTAGSLDAPTGVRLTSQIFAGHKGDYYDLDPIVPADPGPPLSGTKV